MIYWNSGPGWLAQYADLDEIDDEYEHDLFVLMSEIEERYLAGFYTNQSFGFNPANDDSIKSGSVDWTNRYDDVVPVRTIPPEMYFPVEGPIPPDPEPGEFYNDRLPTVVAEEIGLMDDDEYL